LSPLSGTKIASSASGERFGLAISSALERISFLPETFPATSYKMRGEVIRRLLLSRFPFVIYYYVTSDEIVIVAIFHTSRDPGQIPLREED
jgi:plasmid stabilization system protein ParE